MNNSEYKEEDKKNNKIVFKGNSNHKKSLKRWIKLYFKQQKKKYSSVTCFLCHYIFHVQM